MDCPSVVLSLAYCPMHAEMSSIICSKKNTSPSSPDSVEIQEKMMRKAIEGDYSTEHDQENEVGSALREQITPSVTGFSGNGRRLELEESQFKDWVLARSKGKNVRELERLGSGVNVVPESVGESDGFEDLRRYSLLSLQQASKLQSSQYKGVVPQPNGRWGAQIYEKHERVWLGTFNKEKDAAMAYDRAALKFRGWDAMTNFSPARGGNQEARFMGEHTKEQIVDMLRKHSYDEEFEHHSKRIMMTAAWPTCTNNEEQKSEAPGQRWTGTRWPDDGNGNSATAGLLREHLFDKAVTPSDVGKLNRLVIPKLHAEKYFPLVINSSEKGSLLNFEDNMGKVWRFRYSYWKSSQSYVLTKGWSRFVKDKKLEVGDFVSFHRGSSEPHQFYISWRHRASVRPQLGVGPQSKVEFVHPVKGSLSSNSFNSRTQTTVVGNAQWLPFVWPSSSNSEAFTQFNSNYMPPLVKKVGNFDHLWCHIPATPLNGEFSFCFSEPPAKQADQGSFHNSVNSGEGSTNIKPDQGSFHNSLNSGEGSTNIKPLHPFVNPSQLSAAQELETPEHKATWSLDPASKKGVRLFGVSLTES